MREIILDTETTGLDPKSGHRITDIGCVELIDHVPTGNVFQTYLNPEREVSPQAQAICGLPTEFFFDKPKFKDVVDSFLEFVGTDILVIHNAQFDISFINSELERVNYKLIDPARSIDTLAIARRKFPGSPASLDALCKKFNVDLSGREKHGALLDCWLLSEVYINLIGGKQSSLLFECVTSSSVQQSDENYAINKKCRKSRMFNITESETIAHREFLKLINDHMWGKMYS